MKKANLINRFIAFYIDIFIACLIASPFMIMFMPTKLTPFFVFETPYFYAGIILIIIKDITSRSIGKRIMKLYIVSENGGKLPVWKRIVRNLTCCIWPVEALIAVASPDGTRLADKILRTRVVTYN